MQADPVQLPWDSAAATQIKAPRHLRSHQGGFEAKSFFHRDPNVRKCTFENMFYIYSTTLYRIAQLRKALRQNNLAAAFRYDIMGEKFRKESFRGCLTMLNHQCIKNAAKRFWVF
ncbi:MAG: hypothetical protein HFH80_12840 [Lachnospiraceae bacterium]|nr:hypothetical protein [Lachnospiraceae bacterium]